MKTSLEECSKRAPRGRGGGEILPERESKGTTGYAWGPGHQHRRSGLQRCRLGWVRPPERILEAAWVTHPALWQLAPSGDAYFFAACPVHVRCFWGGGAPARVALRAGGACELLLLEATMGSPHPHRSQGPRVRLHRGQRGAALPRLQTTVPLPPPGRCVCHQEGTSRPRVQE